MKPMIVDIDKLDDFIKIAKLAGTIVFADVQNELKDVLFIVPPNAPFPVAYTHHAPSARDHEGWRAKLIDVWVVEATLE